MKSTFGDRLKELRLERNLTQLELAQIFFISKSSVCKYEKGNNFPEASLLQKIADYFSVSVDYLLGKSDDRKIPNDDDIHLKYAVKLADILKRNGYELTEEVIPDIVDYAKYKLEQLKKKQDS